MAKPESSESEKAALFKKQALEGQQRAKRRVNKAKEKEWVKEWEKEEKMQEEVKVKTKQAEERRMLKIERDEKFRKMQVGTSGRARSILYHPVSL